MADKKRTGIAEGMSDGSSQSQDVKVVKEGIPTTSILVMVFILLVAFACAGVQVVTGLVEANNAPEEIKGKNTQPTDAAKYPLPARLPVGVAGNVNGVEIPESQITDDILKMRESLGLQDQEAWDAWMIENGLETETLRNVILLNYINSEMLDQIAAENGITITDADYEAYLEEVKADPARLERLEATLAHEGKTMDDALESIKLTAKKRIIGEQLNKDTLDSPELQESILSFIKSNWEEYKDVSSMEEVSPEIVDEATEYIILLSNQGALGHAVDDFVENHDVQYRVLNVEVPYKSNADMYYRGQEIRQILNKNGLFIPEDQSILDGLIARFTGASDQGEQDNAQDAQDAQDSQGEHPSES